MQINEAPPPLASSLPGRLRELIGQMISKDPTARPQAMTEVIAALEKFEAVPRGPDTGVELRAVRRDRTPLVALGLVAIITLLAGALVAFRPASPAPSVEEKNVQPVPAPAPPVAKVSLLSEPPAEVYEDGALLGMTPLTLSRPPGTLATLEFALKDYEPVRRRLRFETETTVKVTLERKPTRRPAARPAGGPTAVEDLKPSPF